MKSAFDDDSFAFEIHDQRKKRSGLLYVCSPPAFRAVGPRFAHPRPWSQVCSLMAPSAGILLREEDESDLRRARLRLQFAKLMLFQVQRAEIAPDQIEKVRAHQLLKQPEKFLAVVRRFDRNEMPEIHSFVLKRKWGQRYVAVDPHDPFSCGESFRSRFDPERSSARAECAIEKRERALRNPVPEQETVELRHAGLDSFGTFQIPGVAKMRGQSELQSLESHCLYRLTCGEAFARNKCSRIFLI